jgi:hypothetical protein
MRTIGITRFLAIALSVTTLVVAGGDLGVANAEPPYRWLYENKESFRMLSGAAQSLLERHFGPKRSRVRTRASGTEWEPSGPLAPPPGNVLVNNPAVDTTARDTQSETSIVHGSGSNVVVAFNDSNAGANHFTGWSASTNNGASFTDKGSLPASAEGDSGDPVLARDETTGVIYMTTLGNATGTHLQTFRSTDNGQTFGAPVDSTPGYAGTTDFQDKPWMAVDNFPGTGRGTVYISWTRFPAAGGSQLRLSRSTDGGNTWGPSKGLLLGINGQGTSVAVGPDHSVYVVWHDGGTRRLLLRKSTDRGVTFGATITVVTLLTSGSNGDLGLGFRTNAFPQMLVNPVNGHVYIAYNDRSAAGDRGDIFVTRSLDGGAHWSPLPLRINKDATTNDQWGPGIALSPDGTKGLVSWYDRRNDPANSRIERFGSIATIDTSSTAYTFGPDFPISSASFPPVFGQDPGVNATYMGDYDVAVADSTSFYTAWGDNRSSNSVHTNQPDVRAAAFPLNGP